jgi:hypothetical protein
VVYFLDAIHLEYKATGLYAEAVSIFAMVKSKGNKAPRKNGSQGKQAAAPAPSGHAGTQPYHARASHGSGVQTLSTLAHGSQFVKRIEVMDQPGENHFAEALAKSLGPTAKDPTARTQIVSIVTMLEPEAASTGFSSSMAAGPMALMVVRVVSQNSMQMQQSAVGGLGTQNSSSTFGTPPQFGNIPSVSSNPGTTATGGGTQDAPAPAYDSKALATLLKNNVLTMEQVSTTCGSQGIDVNGVCFAASDQPTPRTRGTPRSALRSAGSR